MSERLSEFTLNELNNTTYPGYPLERLLPNNIQFDEHSIVLPDGPWEAGKDNIPPSNEETEVFIRAGYMVDSCGRPLHPNYIDMLTMNSKGFHTGKGKYYN